jgi:hypothetical protein
MSPSNISFNALWETNVMWSARAESLEWEKLRIILDDTMSRSCEGCGSKEAKPVKLLDSNWNLCEKCEKLLKEELKNEYDKLSDDEKNMPSSV